MTAQLTRSGRTGNTLHRAGGARERLVTHAAPIGVRLRRMMIVAEGGFPVGPQLGRFAGDGRLTDAVDGLWGEGNKINGINIKA